MKLSAVREALETHVWAILPSKLLAVLEVVELHAQGGSLTAEEIHARVGDRGTRPSSRVLGSVAVLPLNGVLAPKMNVMSAMSGGTSLEMFGKEFDALVADAEVSAIVIDAMTPGGDVQGTPETAAKVFAARSVKPIITLANGQMCSAGYWIGSAGHEIVATPSAVDIGNIGVYTVHRDLSAANEKEGVKYTIIGAGKYKAEGNPHSPPSDEFVEFTSSKVGEFYAMFTKGVAKHRGVTAEAVRDGYGEGRALTAKQALAAGMVDRIGTLEDAVRRAASLVQDRKAMAASVDLDAESRRRMRARAM